MKCYAATGAALRMKNMPFAFFLIVSFLIFSFVNSSAQKPGAGGQKTNNGHIYGKVIDSVGKPISGVSVMILQDKYDTATGKTKALLLKGSVTKTNGEFSLNGLPTLEGLKLKLSAIGYRTHTQEFSFNSTKEDNRSDKVSLKATKKKNNLSNAFAPDIDLGSIKLHPDVNHLKTVVVTANKPLIQTDIHKMIFNVDQLIVSAGGTAVDVMRNIPSVKVDIDGNVTMRDATPQIYINGKPTTLTLNQIPADEIMSVEVITNPSAKYEASGGNAGILNIVLKKNKKAGHSGNIQAGIDNRGGLNGGVNFNIKQNKFNFFTSLMASRTKNRITGTTSRYRFTDTSAVDIHQGNLNKTNGESLFGRAGLDYFLSDRTTISLSGIKTYTKLKYRETIDIVTDSILGVDERSSFYGNRLSDEERELHGTTIQLGLKHNFPIAGEELTADLNLSDMKWEGNGLYTNDDSGVLSDPLRQKNLIGGHNKLLTIQTDYIKPFSEITKLEAGLRAQVTDISNENENYIQYPGESDFEKIGTATTDYAYINNVYAVYATLSNESKGAFAYELGLRLESSDYAGELRNTGEKFSNKYALSFFPSIFLNQQLKNNQKLQFSVTRRINRPSSFQLTPYTDYTDNLNLTRGNPNLIPEFTNSAEFSYSKTYKSIGTFLVAVYYKYTNDLITQNLVEGENPVTGEESYINTFINAHSGESYGAEFTSTHNVENWWDLTTNINLYNARINLDSIPDALADPLWSIFAKMNNSFKFPNGLTIQLSGDYQSKSNLPINNGQGSDRSISQAQSSSQGYIRSFYGVDMAIKKTFLKDDAASLTLSINDIFRSRKSDQYSEGPGFIQNYYRLNNPQTIRLNFTYRFGNTDMSLSKD